jgi:molybdopterin-binding protein
VGGRDCSEPPVLQEAVGTHTSTSARNVLRGNILHIIKDVGKGEIVVDCGIDLKVSITPATLRKLNLELGSDVYLLIKARALHVLA